MKRGDAICAEARAAGTVLLGSACQGLESKESKRDCARWWIRANPTQQAREETFRESSIVHRRIRLLLSIPAHMPKLRYLAQEKDSARR